MKCLLSVCFFCISLAVQSYAQTVAPVTGTDTATHISRLNERVTIRQIVIQGNKQTKRSIMLREMSIAEGELIATDSLDEVLHLNRLRLVNMALFTDVQFSADTLDASNINVVVRVKEQWYIIPELTVGLADRNFNVWWNEMNHDIRRINVGVELKHRNFRGNMETLSATAQIGYTQKFGLEYFKPYIDKSQKHGVGASFMISKNEETYFITDSNKYLFAKSPGRYLVNRFEAAVQYVYRPGYADKHTFELSYKDYRVNDTIIGLNPDYYENAATNLKMLQLLYRFELNMVDNWNYPMQGIKTVLYTTVRAGFEGMRFQAFSQLEFGYFKKLSRKWYYSNIVRGRVSLPEDQAYYFRNAMGTGSEYLRGYEYYVIDGSQYGLVRTNLKYELVNFSIRNIPFKYLPVLPIRFYPKIFADFGYGSNRYPGNSFLNNRLLYSAGIGFDFVTAYEFKFRFEYTWNHLGENGLFLHMSSE